jgi:hypothetical protein
MSAAVKFPRAGGGERVSPGEFGISFRENEVRKERKKEIERKK